MDGSKRIEESSFHTFHSICMFLPSYFCPTLYCTIFSFSISIFLRYVPLVKLFILFSVVDFSSLWLSTIFSVEGGEAQRDSILVCDRFTKCVGFK